MTKIKIVDSIMGTGKTSGAINLMNTNIENNYIYITPYLSEIERVKQSVNRKFYEPKFYSRDGQIYTKFDSLHELLAEEKSIVSTHALFKRSNEETKELIHSGNYILILDEVMDVVEQLQIKKNDIELLINNELIYIDNGFVKWNTDKKDYDTRYNDIKEMALNNTLIYFRDTILIWTFPVDIFKAFKEVYILTYLFDAQIQKYYYDLFNLHYEKYIAKLDGSNYIFYPFIESYDKELKLNIKSKINIYEGNLNNIGDNEYSLSKTWYEKKGSATLKKLKNNTENYFKNKIKAKSNEIMWTTYKDYQSKLKGRGYAKSFVSATTRATNEYRNRNHLAYTINRFTNPIIYGFFEEKGIKINQELFALSELLQWVWRSAIRDNKEIDLYIPSKRMRRLLVEWLEK